MVSKHRDKAELPFIENKQSNKNNPHMHDSQKGPQKGARNKNGIVKSAVSHR